ncbi:MAG TPA: glycosyltransferase family 39 protein [Burkholderiaceae bacterium]
MILAPRNATVRVALLILFCLAVTAWARPLMLPDEGRYVGVAWEMLRSHDWLTPTLDGLPYFHKPPLFYWITAGSMSLFGMNEFAARAAPILGSLVGALSLWCLARRHGGQQRADMALVALLAQPLFLLGGQFANLDSLVAGCITATVALLAHAALCIEQGLPSRRALWGAYAMAAVGVLAKGLIGFVIPGLVVTVWLLLRGRWRVFLRLFSLPGLLIFLVIAGPWFLLMQQRFPDFLYYFFVVQHFKRFAASGFNNVQPFWFYPAVLLGATVFWWPWLRRVFARNYLSDVTERPLRLLMLCWLALPVLFFSLPQSKLLGYVLPALPPLAWLIADGWALANAATRKPWWISAGVAATLSLAVVIGLAVKPPRSERGLGRALAAHLQAGDAVVMLDQYYFDLPFYAHLIEPTAVVDGWDDPALTGKDTWRKEVFDAGSFAPGRAAPLLVKRADLNALLCRAPRTWVVVSRDALARYPEFAQLAQLPATVSKRGVELLAVDRHKLACPVPG